jgi:hypothetical protein
MIDRADSLNLSNPSQIQDHLAASFPSIPGDIESLHGQAWSLGSAPKVFTLSPLPTDGKSLLHGWFKSNETTFHALLTYLRHSIALEWRSYSRMHEQGSQQVWWPGIARAVCGQEVSFVESAHGDHVRTFTMSTEDAWTSAGQDSGISIPSSASSLSEPLPSEPLEEAYPEEHRLRPVLKNMFDASSSGWTQALGHGHGAMALAIGEASGRYGYVRCPLTLHPPVVTLSR